MRSKDSGTSLLTESAPSFPLGDRLLPAWFEDGPAPVAAATDVVGEPEAESEGAPAGGGELGTRLLPGWFVASDEVADTSNGSALNGLLAPLAAGQCTPAASLAMQLTVPPYPVSRGNGNGDVYTVTVTNNGTVSTTEVSLLIDPNVGFYYLGNSASVVSSVDGPISYTDTGTGAPDATASITLTGTTAQTSLVPGETLTFTFKLATDADAKSGQLLVVSLQSGSLTPVVCQTTQENVRTARGHLVISKSPAAQDGAFGDVVTWTVTLRNTGLGNVYSAILTDTAGIGLTDLTITPTVTPITLTPETSQLYTVTAAIASCKNLTNTVAASWSIGNADGTGTGSNPLGEEADVVFLLADPSVSVQVGPLPDVNYCGALDTTVPVTVTNTGGAARNLRLNLSAQNVTVTNLDPTRWTQTGDLFTYKGGTPVTDTIRSGETITFSVRVTSTNVCAGSTASVSFTPVYQDACLLLEASGTAGSSSSNLGPDAPTLSLSKAGPDAVAAGDTFVYTVTVSGDHQESITGTPGIVITDVVPANLTIHSVDVTRGTTTTAGNAITWTLPITGTGAYSEALFIDVTVPELGAGACGAGGSLINQASAVANVCPECTLSDSASLRTFIQDFLGADNSFSKTASLIELCGAGNTQVITAVLNIRNGITWTNTIYTDTLGQGQFALPLNVVAGTTQVTIDGIDRTSDVTITLGPPLTIDFSSIGAYSTTTDITITYQVTASVGSIVGDAPSQTEFVFSEFTIDDSGLACDGGSTGFFGTYITLRRGDLTAAVSPGTLSSCQENTITITVSGGSPDTLTDHVVVTFTADASDIFTPTNPTLGGAFAGQTVTVTQAANVVTFTFPITLDLDSQGTISFPLFRPCGVSTPLQAGVSYQDRCDVLRFDGATGGTSTTNSNVTLFTTPDEYVVNERIARWRFYVQNGGNQTASDITITNTLPGGYTFVTYTVSSATAPTATLNSITYVTGTVGGREVITFTIPSSPGLEPGDRVQFDVTSTVVSCVSPTQVDIALFQECGQVNGTCGGRQEGLVRFIKGVTSLLGSNNQTANLPLCEEGWIELIIKNTSAASDEFDFTITDVITNATFVTQTARVTVTNQAGNVVTGTTSGVLLQNIPFTPTVTTVGNTDTMTWTVTSFASGTPQYDVLAERDASDVIRIMFLVRTGCAGTQAEIQSGGAAKDVCDLPLTFQEDSQSLLTDAPELTIATTGRNVTTGSSFSDLTYASAGDTVVWQIQVTNVGDQRVLNLFVTDTVPSNFTITETNPITTSQVGDEVSWVITTPTPALDVNETRTFLITGTVEGDICSLVVTNTTQANYGCSTSDICLTTPASDSANLRTQPALQVQSIVGDLNTCGGVITITLVNNGPPAQNVTLTDTLPGGFVYESTVFSTTTPSTLPVSGSSVPTWTWTSPISLPTGTTTLAFRVRNSQTSGSCAEPGTPVQDIVDLRYDDTCTNTGPYTATGSASLTVRSPALVVDKSPLKQISDVGQVVTWTIRITNTGTAAAPGVLVTDVVGSGFTSVTATVGTYTSGGSNLPVVAGNTITWTPAITLPTGGTWSATVTATVLASGTNTDTVQASGTCLAGCIYTITSDIAYATLLEAFSKAPDVQTYTIGSAVVFTITAFMSDQDGLYSNVTLTDTLPTGLGYISSTLTYVYDGDGNSGGPITVTTTPAISPTYKQSGSVIWQLGDLSGTVAITGIVTAVIQNIAANQDGVRRTNTVTMTYAQDGQPYVFTDTAAVDIKEPTLIVEKSVDPVHAAPGDLVSYEVRVYHATTSTVPAYNVAVTDVVPPEVSYIFGSLQIVNPQPPNGVVTDTNSPELTAFFPVISPTFTTTNPVRLRYQGRVIPGVAFGQIITNVVTTTWTSLPDNPFGERRDGSGGVNDYRDSDDAQIYLNDVALDKRGPITITAGSLITYELFVRNIGPLTATQVVVRDYMPFQILSGTITATITVPTLGPGTCTIRPRYNASRPLTDPCIACDLVECQVAQVPAGITARMVITGTVDPNTPLGADLTNRADMTLTSPDGNPRNDTATVDTEVYTQADVGVDKRGPATVTAGQQVSYTIVLSNTGPSTASQVDLKDLLPPGVTYQGGSSSQGTCTSSICQLGDVQPGQVITVVVTGTVGSNVTGTITNTAQVFAATPDQNNANNTDAASSTVKTNAGLQIVKTDLTDPVYAGDTYFYEIVITNSGPSDALNVVITDRLPVYVTFQGASPECTHDGSPADGLVTCRLGTLAAGESRDFLINTRVLSNTANNTTATNYVTATTSTTTTVFSDSEPTTYLQKAGNPTDLQLTKSVTPTSAIAGSGRFTYTLVVTNNGPAAANAVQVVDAYPREFDFVSATASDGSVCNQGMTCDLHEMTVGEQVTITLVVDVPSDVAAGIYTNTATVGSASPESNLNNNTASASTNVTQNAVLQLRKVANPSPATPGQDLNYTIVVTNTGPSDAANVTVSDTLPASFTLALVTSSQGGCASLPCNLGTLPAGGNASVILNGRVAADATGSLTNTAAVTSTTPGTGATYTVTTPLAGSADLALVKTATATANAGERITYTLTVYNHGPSDAQNVRVTDTLPVSATFASASPGCAEGPVGTVVCTATNLTASTSLSFTIVVTVAGEVVPGTSLENAAIVSSDTPDGLLSNNGATADTSILGHADLTISKRQVAPVGSVNAGDLVTYTVTITNTGPGAAHSVDVKDQLPAGVTLQQISASNGGICVGGVCQFGTLGVNATRTITVVARVAADAPAGTITNTAAVFSPDESNPANNTASVTTTVATSADVGVIKVDLKDPVAPGEGLIYELSVSNAGPSDAQNVVVTDTLPAGVTFVNATPPCTNNGNQVICSIGTLPAGTTNRYLIGTMVNTSVVTGTSLLNSVVVTSTTPDANGDNNHSSATTLVEQAFGPPADVAIAKAQVSPSGAVTAGQQVTYTLTVTNVGPAIATNVQVLDLIPAGTSLVSITIANPDFVGEFCTLGGTCYAGTIYTTTQVVITLTLQVDAAVPNGSSLLNQASVSADQPDLNPGNNTAAATTPVVTAVTLELAKRDLADPVAPGETYLYELRVTNLGPSSATDVVITDTLPGGVTFNATASPGCAQASPGVVVCNAGTLAPNGSASFLVGVNVNTTVVSGTVLNNTAVVTTSTPNGLGDTAGVTTTVQQSFGPPADLVIAKAQISPTGAVTAGEQVTYTVTVTDAGPAIATNVQVLDLIPAGTTLVSLTPHNPDFVGEFCNLGGTCSLGTVYTTTVATIQVVLLVGSDVPTGTVLTNQAHVDGAQPDPNPANNTASVGTTVQASADLRIGKTAMPSPTVPGQALTYQIVVTNVGPSAAQDVVVTDTLPAGFSTISVSSSQGGCASLPCSLGTLPAGGQATVTIVGEVSASVTTTLTNLAGVSSTTPDPLLENNTTILTTTVSPSADLVLVKTATATANAGERITYTLTVYNHGPSDAQNVRVTDTLPVSVTFSSASGACANAGGGVVTCTLASLAAGASTSFTITVTVNPNVEPGASLENRAIVRSSTPDANTFNNSATADTSIVGAADVELSKAGPSTVTAGNQLTYTIVVTNHGPSAAQSVDVKDSLPQGVTLDQASVRRTGSGLSACGGAVCQVGDMAVGEVVTITVVGTVAPGVTGTLTNTATAFSDTPDGNPANNTDSAVTTVQSSADLRVSKVDLSDPVGPTDGFLYEIVVSNVGPSDAQNVVVTDSLDANVTFVNASAGCAHDGSPSDGLVTCTVGALAAGGFAHYLIAVTAHDVPTGTVLHNTVGVTSTTPDPVPGNNLDAEDTTVQQPQFGPTADLAIAKAGTPGTVNAGETVTYTLTVTNAGPATATNVQVLELLPFGTTAITITANNPDFEGEFCSLGGTCYLGTVYATTIATVTVVLRVNPNFQGSTLVNLASVNADQRDPNPGNNIASETTAITFRVDLEIEKTSEPQKVYAGEQKKYTIRVHNIGPSEAQNVVVTDTLPAAVSYEIDSDNCMRVSANPDVLTCELGTLRPSETREIEVWAQVAPGTTSGTLITNTAEVTGQNTLGDPDFNPANNTDNARNLVLTKADLRITKFGKPDGQVRAGESLTYTILVDNLGPSFAHDVVVTDLIQSNGIFNLVSVSSDRPATCTPTSGTYSSLQLRCALTGTLEVMSPGAWGRWILTIVVRANAAQSINNVADVVSSDLDPDTGNNHAMVQHQITDVADLEIAKSADPSPVVAGGKITYTLTVTNHGPSAAENVMVYDRLPPGIVVTSAQIAPGPGSCSTGTPGSVADRLTCGLGTIQAGSSATITVVADVSPNLSPGTMLENDAQAVSDVFDNNNANNFASTLTGVNAAADLVVTKADNPPDRVAAGETLQYTIIVTNTGPSDALNVIVEDTLPDGVTFVSANVVNGAGTCLPLPLGRVTCQLGTVEKNAAVTIVVIVEVNPDVAAGTTLTNTVSARSSTPDPNSSNNTGTQTTDVVAQADLEIRKTSSPAKVVAGEQKTYTIEVLNHGPSNAQDVTVKDTLPPGAVVYEIDTALCDESGGVVSCDLGALPAGRSQRFQIIARVLPGASGIITNTATVTSTTTDPDTSDNTATATNLVLGEADLRVEKSDSPDPAVPGKPLTYTVRVYNDGPSDARNVVVTDTLPAHVTYNDAASSAQCDESAPGSGLVTCNLGTVPAGSSVVLTIVVDVDEDIPPPTDRLSNRVEVRSETPDPNPTNNADTEDTGLAAEADVAVSKTGSLTARAGGNLTYTIEVRNFGPSAAQNVVVRDRLPAGLTNVRVTSAACTVGTPGNPGDPMICGLGTLEPGEIVTITITADVLPDVPNGTVLVNDVRVTSDAVDPNNTNNQANWLTTIGAGGVQVDKKAYVRRSPARGIDRTTDGKSEAERCAAYASDNLLALPGDEVTYCYLVTNEGVTWLRAITLSDTSSLITRTPTTDFQVAYPTQPPLRGTVTVNGTGEAQTITIQTTEPNKAVLAPKGVPDDYDHILIIRSFIVDFPRGGTQFLGANTARVDATQSTENSAILPGAPPVSDTDPLHDALGVPVLEDTTKDIRLYEDKDMDGLPSPGDAIEYVVRIPNTGIVEATGVTFTDPLYNYIADDPTDPRVPAWLIPGSVTAQIRVFGRNPVTGRLVDAALEPPDLPFGQSITLLPGWTSDGTAVQGVTLTYPSAQVLNISTPGGDSILVSLQPGLALPPKGRLVRFNGVTYDPPIEVTFSLQITYKVRVKDTVPVDTVILNHGWVDYNEIDLFDQRYPQFDPADPNRFFGSNREANNHAGTPGRAYEKPDFPGWPEIPAGVEPTNYKALLFDNYPRYDDDPTWFAVEREAPSIGPDTRIQLPILKRIGTVAGKAVQATIQVQNLGVSVTAAALWLWGDYSDRCPPRDPGPQDLLCTAQIKPGSAWTWKPTAIPDWARSGVVVSFDPNKYTCDDIRERFFDTGYDPEVYLGGQPVAVVVKRAGPGVPDEMTTVTGAYEGFSRAMEGVEDPTSGGYSYYAPIVYGDKDGLTSWLYLQNSDSAWCTSVEVWVWGQDSCLRPVVCEVSQLAPGETYAMDVAAECLGGGFQGSAYIRASKPLGVVVDHVGNNLLMTYRGVPAELNTGLFGSEPYFTAGSLVNYGPLIYREFQGWDTKVQVQNLSSIHPAKVKVYFLDNSGGVITTLTDWVCPRGSQEFFLPVINGLPGHYVGAVRVESQDWWSPGDPPVPSPRIMSVAELVKYEGPARAEPLEAMAYNLFGEDEAYDWQTGDVESWGVRRIGLPLVDRESQGRSTTEIAIQNVVPVPGFTDFAIYFYDQNGLIDHVCEKLNEKQVEYVDIAQWGFIASRFHGSAVIAATDWNHQVGGQNVVGLAAVLVERSGATLGSDAPGDESAGVQGIPLHRPFKFLRDLPACPGQP